ncbi:MAG: cytoplasmic protein [Desulfobacteraceae bacterium]|nr:cytoplasmic protein [Desulfobacteraceae bacterium]
MAKHAHTFVETYQELVGFGLNRTMDENAVIFYLQKFSDDALMAVMRNRLTDDELSTLFDLISGLLRKHLNEAEYHHLFLKEDDKRS